MEIYNIPGRGPMLCREKGEKIWTFQALDGGNFYCYPSRLSEPLSSEKLKFWISLCENKKELFSESELERLRSWQSPDL